MLLVDDLRAQLAKDRLELEVQVSPACFARKPDKALDNLVSDKSAAVWVLLSAPEATQRWFMQRGLSCVLLGSPHPGIALPALDIDFHAMGQHAARQFLSRGHRRLGVLIPAVDKAGDANTVAAFRAVCEQTPGATALMIEHDGTSAGLQRGLGTMLKKSPPTGLLIAHARHVLTVISFFATQGVRVPRDFSIIARDHESFLDFMVPPLAHYAVSPANFARKLSRLVLKMARGESVPARGHLLMPSFVPGETLAYLSGNKTGERRLSGVGFPLN
jgi:DNA-binding LacI/PurR family transcriptional regulator